MDWKKLYDDVDQWAAAHRQEFIDDISEVCRIRSVSIMNKQDPEKPFGAACRQMLDKALEMSGRYGFETRNYDNFCGSAVYVSELSVIRLILLLLLPLVIPAVSCVSYILGYKNFSVGEKLIYKKK